MMKWLAPLARWTSTSRTAASRKTDIEPLWFEWLALTGLLVFATWLMGVRGVWALLLTSDPTGLTLVILVVFAVSTLWSGSRSRELVRQRHWLNLSRQGAALSEVQGWVGEYLHALAGAPLDIHTPLDLLLENTHGPHQTAWWVNGIQLKLGLLGKVIGFSVLALHIGHMENFDPSQSQDLLKSLTSGLGIALLTTMVGLVGNILLGVQLTRLDRFADVFLADCQREGLRRFSPQR